MKLLTKCALFALALGLLVPAGAGRAASAGNVVAWGCGGTANFGQCTVPDSAVSGVTAVAAGGVHSLALKQDGSVVAWGCRGPSGDINDHGQCVVPAAATSGVVAIAAGSAHSLALKGDGSVVAWGCGGSADWGQCGVPASASSGIKAIAAGAGSTLALTQAGGVIAWGCSNGYDYGQCTVPSTAASGVTAIAAGAYHSLALKQDGSVVAWGCNNGVDYGQCTVPAAAASGVTAIAAGLADSVALKEDGSVVVWGCNGDDFGQCTLPPGTASGVTAVATATSHGLALKQDGSIAAWGCAAENYGQCDVPGAIAGSNVSAVSAGMFHSLALVGTAEPPPPPAPGLLLWNKLGSPDEVTHSAYGPNLVLFNCVQFSCGLDVPGTLGFPAGVFGNGASVTGGPYFSGARVHTAILRASILNPEHGAVEAWYRQTSDPAPYLHNPHRIFGGPYSITGIDEVNLFSQDRLDNGDPRLHFSLFFGAEPPPFVPPHLVAVRSLVDGVEGYRISSLNGQWIHVAGVWDRNGIAGTHDTIRLYVNGSVVAASQDSSWGTTTCDRRLPGTDRCFLDVAGCNDTCADTFAVDNLKVWGYAKTDYGDRFVEAFPPPNRPPDCSGVTVSPASSWPRTRDQMQAVALSGATDPDGDAVGYHIDRVTQDEYVTGLGDDTTPDAALTAAGADSSQVVVRLEANSRFNGRVYRIRYSVSDGKGGTCSGMATTAVQPKKDVPAVDDGDTASWDSFTGARVS